MRRVTLCLLFALSACSREQPRPMPDLAVTGDSIVEGHNTDVSSHGHFHSGFPVGGNPDAEPGHVAAELLGITYENHALGSQGWEWVVSTGLPAAIASEAPVIWTHCGVNDIAASGSWADIEPQLDAARLLVPAETRWIISEILPWRSSDAVLADTYSAEAREVNAELATWCAANDAELLELRAAMGTRRASTGFDDDLRPEFEKGGGDRLHLSEAGVAELGRLFAEHFQGEEFPVAIEDYCVSFWKLGEAAGATRLDSIGDNDLTDHNTVGTATGKIGNGADFTAASSHRLGIGSNSDLSMGDVAFGFFGWFKPDINGTSQMIFSKRTGASSIEYYLNRFSDNKLYFGVSPDGTTNVFVDSGTFTTTVGQWVFFIVWHDPTANTINLKVNDNATRSVSHSAGVLAGSNPFSLGATGDGQLFFDGVQDAIGLFKGAVPDVNDPATLYRGGAGVEWPIETTPPTVSDSYIEEGGTVWALQFSEDVTGHTGHVLRLDGTPVSVAYLDGDGTDLHRFTLPARAEVGETGYTRTYVPGNAADSNGNALAAYSNVAVTNNAEASLTAPDDSRVWGVASPGDTAATAALKIHPSADLVYGLDATNVLPSGKTVSAATVAESVDAGRATAMTVGSPQANTATFTNRDGGTVAIGKGVWWRMSGGASPSDRRFVVVVTDTDGNDYAVSCPGQLRDGA